MSGLKQIYNEKIATELKDKFGYQSMMQVPRVLKVTLNMGLGEAVADKKIVASALSDLTQIAGQKPVTTYARKSIAGFKIREGWPIGAKVTLRKDKMYDFLQRLISITIPRIRDFRGFSVKAFDGRGNYNFGIKEQIVFPEINYDKIDVLRGLDIAISTNAKTNLEGQALLAAFGFPFKDLEG